MFIIGTIPANASTETDEVVDLGGQTVELGMAGVIEGGHVQSEDPTRYDYVPETSNDDEMQASNAIGVQAIPAFTIGTGAGGVSVSIPVPAGYLGHDIFGTKLKVTKEVGTYFRFASAPSPWNISLCDVRMDFQNRSSAGAIHRTYPGTTKWGCFKNWFPQRTDNTPRTLKAGKQCARLYVGGAFRGEQCHTIKP